MVNEIPLDVGGIIEVAKNIYTIPGMWHVQHIVQSDGIVVIEGPISSGYNRQHIEFIKKKYPNKPIKAVVVSSDAWPHLGGIRAFVADNIPVYTQFLNQGIISQVLKADYSMNPDKYQNHPQKANLKLVSERISINDPDTPIQIIPVNGEGGERKVALYFPKQKLLYASDLIQLQGRNRDSFFAPQYLTEVKAVVDKYQLDVVTVFAMHTAPIPWQQVLDALEKY